MEAKIISAYRKGINALAKPKSSNGFFGISASYPFFSNEDLESYCEKYYSHKKIDEFIKFGVNNFDKFLVILVDYLLHYNIMAFNNLNNKEALKIAKKIGDILEKRIKKTLLKYKNKIIFLRWENIKKDKEFNYILKTIRTFAKENKEFKKECIELTISATWNKLRIVKKKYGNKRYKKILSIAKDYSLDDIALCLYLYHNFPVEISKYEPPRIIKKIYNGLFPNLNRKLRFFNIGHIQLSFDDSPVHLDYYDDEWEDVKQNEKQKITKTRFEYNQ